MERRARPKARLRHGSSGELISRCRLVCGGGGVTGAPLLSGTQPLGPQASQQQLQSRQGTWLPTPPLPTTASGPWDRQQWRFPVSSPEQGWAPGSTVSNRCRAGFRRMASRPPAWHASYQKADGLPWPPACSPRKSPGSQVSAETSRLCRSELPAHLRRAKRHVRDTSQPLDSGRNRVPKQPRGRRGQAPGPEPALRQGSQAALALTPPASQGQSGAPQGPRASPQSSLCTGSRGTPGAAHQNAAASAFGTVPST